MDGKDLNFGAPGNPEPSNAQLMQGISVILSQLTEMREETRKDKEKQWEKNLDFEQKLKTHDEKFEKTYKKEMRNNIVIYGWEDIVNKPLHIIRPKVVELFSDKLTLKDIRTFDIHDIRVVGTQKNVLIVTLCSPYLTRMIINNASKLKGTKIFINYDLSPEERAVKKKLLTYKNNLSSQGKVCKLKNNTQLVVDGRNFTLEELDAGIGGSGTRPSQEPGAGAVDSATEPDYEMSDTAKKRTPPHQETRQQHKKALLAPAKIDISTFPQATGPDKNS